jgi:hypothetical protein
VAPPGSATIKAIDYSVDNGDMPISTNCVDNRIIGPITAPFRSSASAHPWITGWP